MMQALMISYPIMSGLVSRLTQHLKSSDRKHPNDALSLLSLRIFFSLKLRPINFSLKLQPINFSFQLFREELERVVGDSMRESGTEGISALLSDVMNIKNGSEFLCFYQSPRTFFTRKAANNFQGEEFLRFLCNVYADRQALERGWRRSGPGFIFQTNQKLFKDYQYSPKNLIGQNSKEGRGRSRQDSPFTASIFQLSPFN